MRIKHFKPDGEQLPTSLWFMADNYPVQYKMVDMMTINFYFYNKNWPTEEILSAANKVFCRQPANYGNPRWIVKEIKELNHEDEYERIYQVKYDFE